MLMLPGIAAAQDIQRGRELALRWCSACHTVERRRPKRALTAWLTFPPSRPCRDSTERLRAAITPHARSHARPSLGKRDQDDSRPTSSACGRNDQSFRLFEAPSMSRVSSSTPTR